MKVDTPEIRWHYGPTGLNEAVLTIDYLRRTSPLPNATGDTDNTASSTPHLESSTSGNTPPPLPTVLATGGSDKEVRLWIMPTDDPLPVYVYTLSAHDRSVNCVRFSPDGSILASASDDSTIILWSRPKHLVDGDALSWDWSTVANNSDVGRVLLACGHKGDITDLSWSPDSQYLCSVSVDNTASIWHVPTAKLVEKRKDHSQFVQGVAWDPLSEFLVTTGNDRTARIYALHGYHALSSSGATAKKKKCQLLHTNRALGPAHPPKDKDVAPNESPVAGNDTTVAEPVVKTPKQLLFHDDTFPSFSRRPAWTPDGNFCIFPTGLSYRDESATATAHTAYVYARGNLLEPAFHLPGHDKGALAIRCSPVLYALRDLPLNTFGLPYRVIFAVATLTSVAIYDSQLPRPICVVDRVHYADLTDMSWSADGAVLAASSLDGYVSLITLTAAELGEPMPPTDLATHLAAQRAKMLHNMPRGRKKVATTSTTTTSVSPVKPLQVAPATTTPDKKETPVAKKLKPTDGASSIRQFTTVISPHFVFDPANMPIAIPHDQPNAKAAAPLVHAVAVRKKRKITPVLVTPTSAAAPAPVASTSPRKIDIPAPTTAGESPKTRTGTSASTSIDLTMDDADDGTQETKTVAESNGK